MNIWSAEICGGESSQISTKLFESTTFTSVVVVLQNNFAAELRRTNPAEIIRSAEITEKAVPSFAKNKDKPTEAVFDSLIPVRIEVFAFLAAWEAPTSTIIGPFGPMELDSPPFSVSQDMFEPAQPIRNTAPPQRLYRRYRRSTARKSSAC